MSTRESVLALLLAAVLAPGCAEREARDEWALFANFERAARLEIVASPGVLREQALGLARDARRIRGIEVVVDGTGDATTPRLVLGTFDDPSVARLVASVGVEVSANGDGFTVLGREHRGEHAALVACLRDPDRPMFPLVVCAGTRPDSLAQRARFSVAPWKPRLTTWTGAGLELDVELSIDGATLRDTLIDHGAARAEAWSSARRVETARVTYHAEPNVAPVRLETYIRRAERTLDRAAEWLGVELEAPLDVYVHGSLESFEREVGRTDLVRVDPVTSRVDLLLTGGLPGDAGRGVARAFARETLGEPAEAWLADGFAIAVAGVYWGRQLGDWCALLRDANRLPPVGELTHPRTVDLRTEDDPGERSQHVLLPARGLLVRRARDQGADLAAAWTGTTPLLSDGIELDGPPASEDVRRARRERRARCAAAVRRGVALFEPSRRDAYASSGVRASLERAREHGADAFSVTVLASFVPESRGLFNEPVIDGSSSDVALASALAAGGLLGLAEMLVVEPVLAPWSTWLDGGRFVGPKENARFFTRFERIAVHYALLAELCGVDVLCVGAGLRLASRTKLNAEDTDYVVNMKTTRRELWAELVASVRAVFSGALTYAAYDRSEAKRIAHWDSFDSIGLLGFSPLSFEPGEVVTDRNMRSKVHTMLARARKLADEWKLPVAFVEVGFPARSDSWLRPDVPTGVADEEAQRRFYDALARALEREATAKTQVGLYLWNWSTERAGLDRSGGGYTPQGKLAEAKLARILRRE